MMLLDASAGGSIKNKTNEEVKELVEQMCQKWVGLYRRLK
jgi:hypothetical protein